MTLHSIEKGVALFHADCLDLMRSGLIADESIDAIVTDPPYGLGFMGKEWDSLPPGEEWAAECLRVLKPGGHMLAFGGTRTFHRLTCAVEDAGFEIRDSIAWLYGSGFPKSLNVGKAIASGTGRPEDIRRLSMGDDYTPSGRGRVNYDHGGGSVMNGASGTIEMPDAARTWEGWGTALKPAFEPVVVARKPLQGTVAGNVTAWGTGALNVDGCRIEAPDERAPVTGFKNKSLLNRNAQANDRPWMKAADPEASGAVQPHPPGRWPANVVLDESQAAALDQMSGDSVSLGGSRGAGGQHGTYSPLAAQPDVKPGYGDTGGASRFFYCAKASKAERPVVDGVAHPTVKPLKLMRWLVRLVTPPGGIVLDPFAGSGTTAEACILEGFRCLAIEQGAEYLPHIGVRIERATPPAAEDGDAA